MRESPTVGEPWDLVVINTSGGKDSMVAVLEVLSMARELVEDRSRIVLSHQCLGRMEWPGTLDLVKEHAAALELRLMVSRYRSKAREEKTLLQYARERGKWPDNGNRWCTSEFKRGPGGRVITALSRELALDRPARVLNVFGFRAEESPARAKKKPFVRNTRWCSGRKEVWDWLPVHDWKVGRVWGTIRESGLRHHPAYDLGMSRISCCFCIFAPASQLMLAGKANPELLDEYVEAEIEMGHTFQKDLSLVEIKRRIQAGEQPVEDDGAWNM